MVPFGKLDFLGGRPKIFDMFVVFVSPGNESMEARNHGGFSGNPILKKNFP